MVVILTKTGKEQLDHFKLLIRKGITSRFEEQSFLMKNTIRAFRPVAIKIAKTIVAHYDPARTSLLYGGEMETELNE